MLVVAGLLLGTAFTALAQGQNDVIYMLDGKQMEGKVTSMGSSTIKFTYKGEALEYELSKDDINKITFTSGRTEIIHDAAAAAKTTSTAEERKDKIAVLPFDYITNDGTVMAESMRDVVQSACYKSIKENTGSLNLQDPATTNALLAKNSISFDNIKTFTPKEIAEILAVEYVVYGTANVQNKGAFTYGSGVTTTTGKENTDKNKNTTKKTTNTAVTSSSSSTLITYNTHIDLSIYNDQGAGIYTESRESFGSGQDAYIATINYLVKRCPFGKKAKN